MTLNCFVVAPPGLEELCRTELRQIGLTPDPVEPGGVAFPATHEQLYRANLQLRVASRVLVRVASFHAAHFSDLEKAAQQVDWGRWIASGSLIEFRVSSHKSRLYHQKAIAERLLGIMSRRVSGVSLAATDSAAAVKKASPRDLFTGTATSTPTEAYYSTLLHEEIHGSGATHRLNRQFGERFGDKTYAFEELVARHRDKIYARAFSMMRGEEIGRAHV